MRPREIRKNVYLVGAVDWDRRLFDALIPLPQGTSYNAYVVVGQEKTALLDSVDPSKWDELEAQLAGAAGAGLHRGPPRRAGPLGQHRQAGRKVPSGARSWPTRSARQS